MLNLITGLYFIPRSNWFNISVQSENSCRIYYLYRSERILKKGTEEGKIGIQRCLEAINSSLDETIHQSSQVVNLEPGFSGSKPETRDLR